jgi:Zn-dependent protease
VFNLLPLPPLDGSKVLAYFLPRQSQHTYAQLERYGPMVLILLIFSGYLWRILTPLLSAVEGVIVTMVMFLARL